MRISRASLVCFVLGRPGALPHSALLNPRNDFGVKSIAVLCDRRIQLLDLLWVRGWLFRMGAVLLVIRDPAANDSGLDERENDFQKLEQLSTDSGMFWLFVGPS